MKKWTYPDWLLLSTAVAAGLTHVEIQFVTGKSVNGFLTAFLFVLASFCLQMLTCRLFSSRFWKRLPLVLAGLYGLWSIWLFCTSPAWQYATIVGLISDCLTPAIGCAAACAVCKFKHS